MDSRGQWPSMSLLINSAAAPVKEMLRRFGSPDPDWDDWTWVDE